MDAKKNGYQILAVVGHEMRSSLSAIQNALVVWAYRDPHALDDLRHLIDRQLRQLTRLSDDLMDTARISRGKFMLQKAPVCLQRAIAEAIEQIQPFITHRKHFIETKFPDSPVLINGDTSRLTQVFANLLQNAAKFTPGLGVIHISLEVLQDNAIVRVRDNGQGIARSRLATIFEDEKTFDNTQELDCTGLGFGLKLVKAIAESHGGTVSANSQGVGRGSTFTVTLPLLNATTVAYGRSQNDFVMPAYGDRPARQLKILVIDSVGADRDAWARRISGLGHNVRLAANTEDAIQQVCEFSPQIVFVNLAVSTMDAYQLPEKLRKFRNPHEMVTVAVREGGQEDDKLRAKDVGYDVYLDKPTEVPVLEQVLLAVCANRVFHLDPSPSQC